MPGRKKVLVFIVAYNAERTIEQVLRRIPPALAEHDTQILIIDDSSDDHTFERARQLENAPFPTTVLFNPVNQGYGGNQKIGFHYAIREQFDFVALVHGDGQYAPEQLPELLRPLIAGEADAVFGSRMMAGGGALKGGMPFYKFAGNKLLTKIQNALLKASLSEFHSGYRVYSVKALERVPFELNTNDFHFDTEIIIQLIRACLRITELPIPTYYGDEVCHVNGLKYAWDVIKTTLRARVQDLGILYERKFDVYERELRPSYGAKSSFTSPHTLALDRVKPGSKVLDIGSGSGYVERVLRDRGCEVTRIDPFPSIENGMQKVVPADSRPGEFPLDPGAFQYVLLLDFIEHLRSPEQFVEALRQSRRQTADTLVIASAANVAFFITRLMLLFGYFHYSARGILDLTHTRLYTFQTLQKLFEQAGYQIVETHGVPAPFPLALGNNRLARTLLALNQGLIKVWRSLFSYEIFMIVRPLPALEWLLERAVETSNLRIAEAFSSPEGERS